MKVVPSLIPPMAASRAQPIRSVLSGNLSAAVFSADLVHGESDNRERGKGEDAGMVAQRGEKGERGATVHVRGRRVARAEETPSRARRSALALLWQREP